MPALDKNIKTNNNMNRKLIITVLASLALSFVSYGNVRELSAEARADAMTEWMVEKLELEEPIVEPIAALNLKYAREADKIMGESKSKFSAFKKMKASMKEKDKELEQIFDKETFDLYESLKSNMRKDIEARLKAK